MRFLLVLFWLAVMLAACAAPHDDGMGDLWKGVRHVEGGVG